MSQLFEELKRRNVFRVALAYLALGWLVLQVAQLVLESTSAPDWVMQVFLLAVAVGFPFAILFAWAFEVTPEGIKREKDVDRTQSITDQTGRKLNLTIIIVLVAAVAFLLIDKFALQEHATPAVPATDRSVAVLPFVTMSSGPDDEYFSDGLTEEILNSLTRVPELLVTARTSAFHFKDKDIPIPEIAAILGVAHIVEGSVRRSGERLRVTAQLIRAQDGFHLWSETYDHDTKDAFGVQTDIAEKIASALDVVLDDEQRQKMRSVGLQNPEAYIAFQKGLELFNAAHGAQGQIDKMLVANEWFEKTMALAPEFSDVYGYHSDYFTHVLLDDSLTDPPTTEELTSAMASLEVDLSNAIRHAPDEGRRNANAFDLDLVRGQWRGLQARFDEIVEESKCYSPNWPEMVTLPFGQANGVGELMQRAVNCDPLAFAGWMTLASSSQWQGNFDAAIETSRLGLEVTGHDLLVNELFNSLIGAGRYEEATKILDREFRSESGRIYRLLKMAAMQGDRAATEALLDQYQAIATGRGNLMVAASIAGRRKSANEIAAAIDAEPYGYLKLLRSIHECICGAPFDLEATPDFAVRVGEAELPWPPLSPIDWPLKDW